MHIFKFLSLFNPTKIYSFKCSKLRLLVLSVIAIYYVLTCKKLARTLFLGSLNKKVLKKTGKIKETF